MKFTMLKSDRDACVLLILIILVAAILIPLLSREGDDYGGRQRQGEQTASRFYDKRGNSRSYSGNVREGQPYYDSAKGAEELFYFDPNTADSTQLLRLGLRPWQVRNIYKYRAKGGRYRKKEDFAMLYGLTLEHYRRLEPYIRIKPEVMARDVIKASANYTSRVDNSNHASSPRVRDGERLADGGGVSITKLRMGETVDINTADTTELKRIPGIGSYFAMRIVELRARRQAFVTPEELLVIRNFPEHSLHYMTASQNFAKVRINHATLQQLKSHPLINHTQATDILNYRRLNGDIHSASEMSNFTSFTEAQLARLAPFLVFD